MLEAGIVALLKASSAFTDVAGIRIYSMLLPESICMDAGHPSVTYQLILDRGHTTLEGSLQQEARYQFDCWGLLDSDAIAASEALLNVLQGYQGILPGGTNVSSCTFQTQQSLYEEAARIYRRRNEYLFFYRG